jgi:hypothetical protein
MIFISTEKVIKTENRKGMFVSGSLTKPLQTIFFNRCSTVHFDKYEIFLVQQMHYILKHKILQFVFKCLNIHFSAPLASVHLDHLQGEHNRTLLKLPKL